MTPKTYSGGQVLLVHRLAVVWSSSLMLAVVMSAVAAPGSDRDEGVLHARVLVV
jgi:hypothetical protein